MAARSGQAGATTLRPIMDIASDIGLPSGDVHPYGAFKAYGQSKLCNVLFTRELARRHASDGLVTFSAHPGPVGTNIMGRGLLNRTLYRLIGAYMSPKRGARTSVYLASAEGIEANSGAYYNESVEVKPGSKLSNDEALAKRLWAESARLAAAVG